MFRIKSIIGIDIGGTFIRCGIINENLELSNFTRMKIENKENYEHILNLIINYYNEINRHNQINTIRIGIPGIIEKDTNKIISLPNLHVLENESFVKDLSDRLQCKIILDKDVNHLFTYDIYANGITSHENIIGFYIGTGFGCALKLNNHLIRGDNNFSGEIGHIPIHKNPRKCGCGNIGCLETIASGSYLVELWKNYFRDIELDSLFNIYANHPIIKEFVDNIAIGIVSALNLLDINQVILGGGVIQMKDFPKTTLEESVKAKIRSEALRTKLQLYYTESNHQAGVIGAGILEFK